MKHNYLDETNSKNARLSLELAADQIRQVRTWSEGHGNVLESLLDCLDRDLEFSIRIAKVYEKMDSEEQEHQQQSVQDESGMSGESI